MPERRPPRPLLPLGEWDARLLVRLVGAAGIGVGIGSVAMPRAGLRAIGLEADGRGVGLMARLFGCRDIAICATLLRVAGQENPELSWLDMLAASQVGDLAIAVWLNRRGELSRRGLATILLTAPPTLAATVMARRALAAAASRPPGLPAT